MSNNESHLWDEKYKNSREYDNKEDYLRFSNENPTFLAIKPYLKEGISILEIGSGTGEIISYIKDKYKNSDAYGLDYSDISVNNSQKNSSRFGISVNFTQGDIMNMNFEDSKFDVIFGDQVIGHIEDYSKAIIEIKRVLKPGGILALSTSNKLRPDGWDLYKKLSDKNINYLQKSFYPHELKKIFINSGFKVEKLYGDMPILLRNIKLIKNKFVKNKTIVSSKYYIQDKNTKSNQSYFKKIYNFLDSVMPNWFKISIGIIAIKNG